MINALMIETERLVSHHRKFGLKDALDKIELLLLNFLIFSELKINTNTS